MAIATVNPCKIYLQLAVEIKCAEKKLSVAQSTHTFYIRATNFCLFCAKNNILVIACDICGSRLFFKAFPYSVVLCASVFLSFYSFVKVQIFEIQSDTSEVGCYGKTTGEQDPEHCSTHD